MTRDEAQHRNRAFYDAVMPGESCRQGLQPPEKFTTPPVTTKLAGHAAKLNLIRAEAHRFFENAGGSHDWEHTLRVHRLCLHLGPAQDADMFVLQAAAYLHDIGRPAQDAAAGALCHAAKGAGLALEILRPLDIDADRTKNIVHCIRAHRFRDDCLPVTIEAKVLFDADKLDAIGAVGIARAYQFAGELGACLHNPHSDPQRSLPYSRDDTGYREFVVKLSKIKDRMLTPEGRRLARERHDFMTSFFDRFLKEYAGEA